ncbi:hypothetical protein ACKI2N_006200 [Cupriavidus sp. 30B13]|uniref:hypothetical protein n=1 Tax=Cupriavidus sp. 30B13 TaxID=3384241 RepID=UPI003B8F2321
MQGYRSDLPDPMKAVAPVAPATPGGAPRAQMLDLETSRVLRFHARAGTALYVLEGELALSGAPRWLAGTMWRQPQRLPAGSMVVLPSGWVELLATRAATLRLHAPAARPRRLARLSRWLARRLSPGTPAHASQCFHGEQHK